MRNCNSGDIRTSEKGILVGTKTFDKVTGNPVALIKGNGKKFDTLDLEQFVVALYGQKAKATITYDN